MDEVIDPPVEPTPVPPEEPVSIDVVINVDAGGPSRVEHIKAGLHFAAECLIQSRYDFAASRVIDALTFIEAQQYRQGGAA